LASRTPNKNTVRIHKVALVINLLIGVGITLLMLFIGAFNKNDIPTNAFIAVLSFPLILIEVLSSLAYANYRIDYDDSGFAYQSILREKRKYDYSDIVGIIDDKYNAKLVTSDGKKLALPAISIGRRGFMESIEKWRQSNNKVPKKIPKTREPLFNDNIMDAEGFVALWIICLVFAGSLFIGTTIIAFPRGDYIVIIIVGCFLLPLLIIGPFFYYIVRNAERHPRITGALVKKHYIKNPNVRYKLGLRPIKKENKKRMK